MILSLLLACASAFAWEPVAEKLPARQKQLQAAFERKDDKAVKLDKHGRGGQKKRPAWAAKAGTAWTEELDGKTVYFAVGETRSGRNKALTVGGAENRARGALVRLRYGSRTTTTAGATMTVSEGKTEASGVDWYEDRAKKRFYALVAETVE
jgi:hypothetical protein